MNHSTSTVRIARGVKGSTRVARGLATLLLGLVPVSTHGQEPVPMAPASAAQAGITWLADYEGARKVSSERGMPLLIEIGVDNCPWCKQMETVTLAEPKVLAKLKAEWVCLKVDGRRNPQLVSALGLRNYPTHVYADPTGKILGSNEGFVDPAAFLAALDKAAAGPEAPAWLAGALEEARKARANQDRGRASLLLRLITESEFRGPLYSQAKAMLQNLDAEASARGNTEPLVGPLQKSTGVPNTLPDAAREDTTARESAKATLASRSTDSAGSPPMEAGAKSLMEQMEEERKQGHLAGMLEISEKLLAQFPDSEEAKKARDEVQAIRNDPDKLRVVAEQSAEKLAGLYLNLAEAWIGKGKPQQGVFYLEKVLITFPGSRHADTAQARLAQVQGPPPLGGLSR